MLELKRKKIHHEDTKHTKKSEEKDTSV